MRKSISKTVDVSILCLTYNHERYIEKCLEGFLKQKVSFSYEILIHDDCSKDNTRNIIEKYAEQNENVIPIFQKQNQYSQGVYILQDILLPLARGKYIALCEGDDYWIGDNKLQMQYEFLEKNPDYVACVHNTRLHDCVIDNAFFDYDMYKYSRDCDVSLESILMEWTVGGFHTSSVFARTDLMKNNPLAKQWTFGDLPNAINLAANGKIRFMAYTLSVYNYCSGIDCTRYDCKTRMDKINGCISFIDSCKKTIPFLAPEYGDMLGTIILNVEEDVRKYEEMTDEEFEKLNNHQEKLRLSKLCVRKFSPVLIDIYNYLRRNLVLMKH